MQMTLKRCKQCVLVFLVRLRATVNCGFDIQLRAWRREKDEGCRSYFCMLLNAFFHPLLTKIICSLAPVSVSSCMYYAYVTFHSFTCLLNMICKLNMHTPRLCLSCLSVLLSSSPIVRLQLWWVSLSTFPPLDCNRCGAAHSSLLRWMPAGCLEQTTAGLWMSTWV